MLFDLAENACKNFDNYVSLGYFCEVATDLEKIGLRNTSSPFDWCISQFQSIIRLIEDRFDAFLDRENMAQSIQNRNIYMDQKNSIFFFHDFSQYKPCDVQYETVKEKYTRRISRFLERIQSPTLFVRYISNEIRDDSGKSVELQWIEDHAEDINRTIKKYNAQNSIVFIGDENTNSNRIKIYHVKINENDVVSRSPIFSNKELFPIISQYHVEGQEHNKALYAAKAKKKNSVYTKIKKKIIWLSNELFRKKYNYTSQYDIPNK